jgi:hypothetical protein
VTGTDPAGDTWTLKLIGPGSLLVTKQNDSSGNPAPLDSATDINTITVAGGDPLTTRLVGTVVKAANSDGRVFFDNLTELGSHSDRLTSGNGLLAINMPDFWLGNTTPNGATTSGTPPASITIPDGVATLRFGGVDTTFNQAAATSTSQNDQDSITLGMPAYGGTRIIIDQSITNTQSVTQSGSTTPTIIQHGVLFNVTGRLGIFQANAIIGDAANPSGQFPNSGGTVVESLPNTVQAITGQIGFVNVGGNATNFSVLTNDRMSNFFIGGETNNVFVLTPSGSRNLYFGNGLDNVIINSHVIDNLQANRGANNSTVISDKAIGRVLLGGDVTNTNILSGYTQNLSNSVSSQTSPSLNPPASTDGGMTALVAGDVTNSVFAASTQPFSSTSGATPVFGTPNDMKLPTGNIMAKVEGTIDNSVATPESPTTAFYARDVQLAHGPVIPPAVPLAPYPPPEQPTHLPGINGLSRSATAATAARPAATTPHAAASATRLGGTIPRGPRAAVPIRNHR